MCWAHAETNIKETVICTAVVYALQTCLGQVNALASSACERAYIG